MKNFRQVKEFTSRLEAKQFCMEIYGEYVKALDESTINKLLVVQSSALTFSTEILQDIGDIIDSFPEVPYDIVVYYVGNMKEKNNLYLSATLMKSIADELASKNAQKVYKIIVKQGAKMVPFFPINQLSNIGDPELEVVLNPTRVKKHFGNYYYK